MQLADKAAPPQQQEPSEPEQTVTQEGKEHGGSQGDRWVCRGAGRGTVKGGCSLLHRLDLQTPLPSCHGAEEAEQLLLPQGVSSLRSGPREP